MGKYFDKMLATSKEKHRYCRLGCKKVESHICKLTANVSISANESTGFRCVLSSFMLNFLQL